MSDTYWDPTIDALERIGMPGSMQVARVLTTLAPRWSGEIDATGAIREVVFVPAGSTVPHDRFIQVAHLDDGFSCTEVGDGRRVVHPPATREDVETWLAARFAAWVGGADSVGP